MSLGQTEKAEMVCRGEYVASNSTNDELRSASRCSKVKVEELWQLLKYHLPERYFKVIRNCMHGLATYEAVSVVEVVVTLQGLHVSDRVLAWTICVVTSASV